MSAHVISFINQKGGIGKTTTAVNLAAAIAERGRRTLIIDLDAQGHVWLMLGGESKEPGVYSVLAQGQPPLDWIREPRPNLLVLPGDKTTATMTLLLIRNQERVTWLRTQVKQLAQDVEADYVVIDTNPAVGGLQEYAIAASDVVIIPTQPNYLGEDGVSETIETLQAMTREQTWSGALLGILPTACNGYTEAETALTELRQTFGDHMVLPPLSRTDMFPKAVRAGKTILEWPGAAHLAAEFRALAGLAMKAR